MTAAPSSYAAPFRQQVLRCAAYSLTCVTAAAHGLNAADRDAALHALSYALALDEAWPVTRELLLALAPRMQAVVFVRDEWSRYLERGIAVAQASGDAVIEAELRWTLGILREGQAAYGDACGELEAAAALFRQIQAPRQEARALNRLAYVARRQRRLDVAEALVGRAFALLDDAAPERAYGYLVQGAIALDRNSPHAAVGYFRSALAALGPDPDPRERAWNLTNLGLALWRSGEPVEATGCYGEAIRLYESEGEDAIHCAVAQMNLAILFIQDQPEASLRLSLAAREVFHQVGDLLRLAKVHNNIGMACTNLRRWEDARVAIETSLMYWDRMGDALGRADTLDTLGQLWLAQGDYRRAATVYDQAERELSAAPDTPEAARLRGVLADQRRHAEARRAGA